MNKYRICVYAICKDEEKFVDRWMDSMNEADMVVVTDTGSTDDTVTKLRKRGATVFEEKIVPWRFDTARNISLSHVPDDMDIAVCTDLDEIFRPGWRKFLEEAWTSDITMANYLYNWSLKKDGTPYTQFTYFKIHVKDCYEWTCPVHEYLKFKSKKLREKKVFVPGMILDHHPDSSKSRGSYLGLLESGVKENPLDSRMAYYLGREYMYSQRWEDCIKTLKTHLKLPTANWKEERCASMRWIAKSYHNLDKNDESYNWYFRAISELPNMRDPYIELAKAAYSLNDWETVLLMTSEALRIKEKSKSYVNMGYAWDYTPNDLAAIAYYRLGNYEMSLAHAELALRFASNDARLKNNYALIKEKCCQRR